MERDSYLPLFLFVCLVMAQVTLLSIPCLAQDHIAPGKASFTPGELKFGVRIYPITRELVEKPMEISFHGRSGNHHDDLRSDHLESSGENSSGSMEIISRGDAIGPSAPIGFNDHLDRIHAYLFQYISITPSVSNLGIKQGYSMGTKIAKQRDHISFKIQADPSDLSGGLVFIMPI